ncbi:methyl-accepting chemotaxis protein [Butyrivibrio sp. MC2013]|uniref:methyl-accepting chemotaxis protein n=1 Tax=Butyrivibrio sp. MC2013 TaxID=1280686 RepID=UPI00041C82ED|nr:methyl-accepting chemotaxis protein [Butyrivibrio sp. MC2013]
MSKVDSKDTKSPKAISVKLSFLFVALLIITIAIAESVTLGVSYNMMSKLTHKSLTNQVGEKAIEINKELSSTFYYLNGVADAIEQNEFKDRQAIVDYLVGTINRYEMIPTGAYLTLEDETFIYAPDPDFTMENILEKPWYQQCIGFTNSWFYFYDVPYFDTITGDLCATVLRHIHMKDGRDGCFAADLMLASSQERLNEDTGYKTGGYMMITEQGLILSYSADSSYNGQKTADITDNPFLVAAGEFVASEAGKDTPEVSSVKVGKVNYYMTSYNISGTDWRVVLYADQNEVMGSLTRLTIILVVGLLIAIIIIVIILNIVLKKIIKDPVTALTDNIGKISNGDFAINITSDGNDEIAYMNRAMGEFVEGMRSSLGEIKDVSGRLQDDANTSKTTAESLEDAANNQSVSMTQIRENIDNMASAVNEVAENATVLAQTVADVTEDEKKIENAMNDLVVKANAGQKDMATVASGMNDIVSSMNDMSEAVNSVNDAADKINEIIDLINSISSQTNLLSLNASIEAARAGEMGKGFAVVANEIGTLAQNSAEATNQIAGIIKDMSARVQMLSEKSESNSVLINNSSESVNKAASTFEEITSELSKASDILSQMAGQMETVNDVAANMASVSEEQSASTQEIAENVEHVTEAAKGVASSSEKVAQAANSVTEAVDTINGNLDRFTI